MSPAARPGDAPALPVFVRYADLVSANIVQNWTTLMRLIECEEFPEGVRLTPHTRAWRLDEIEAWLAKRPTSRRAVPGDAEHPRGKKWRRKKASPPVSDKRRAAAEA